MISLTKYKSKIKLLARSFQKLLFVLFSVTIGQKFVYTVFYSIWPYGRIKWIWTCYAKSAKRNLIFEICMGKLMVFTSESLKIRAVPVRNSSWNFGNIFRKDQFLIIGTPEPNTKGWIYPNVDREVFRTDFFMILKIIFNWDYFLGVETPFDTSKNQTESKNFFFDSWNIKQLEGFFYNYLVSIDGEFHREPIMMHISWKKSTKSHKQIFLKMLKF
jgi:hypothetical protein